MQERLIFKESAEEAASEQLVPQQDLPEQASRSPCLKANLYPLEASAEEMLQREQLRICSFEQGMSNARSLGQSGELLQMRGLLSCTEFKLARRTISETAKAV